MDFQESYENTFVEAIEEGRIVRVSESYAKKEGLPILRKSIRSQDIQQKTQMESKSKIEKEYRDERSKRLLDHLRKPSGWKEKQVISELIQNFNWQILRRRRDKGMTRKQLAKLTGSDEDSIKLIENGLLPSPDFILINKIQNVLNLNLRKDKIDFNKEITLDKIKDEVKKQDSSGIKQNKETIIGNDIKVFE